MSEKNKNKINESEVVNLWREQVSQRRIFTDAEGLNLEVIYPGRLNDSRGADFRDAVISSGQGKRKGSIEIHTLASCWKAHGHHRDPVYNQVVLHVALKRDRSGDTFLFNGEKVPTLILEKYLSPDHGKSEALTGLRCRGVGRKIKSEEFIHVLEKAGDQRFEAKAARFQNEQRILGSEQSFYQGLLEALGYAKNKEPFLELARRAPLKLLNSLIQTAKSEEEGLLNTQAYLLGQAGFLPSQRPGCIKDNAEAYVTQLERRWNAAPGAGVMDSRYWELFKVRPGNHPIRRIIALSWLLYRYRTAGLLESLLIMLNESHSAGTPAGLETALVAPAKGYWTRHYNFGPGDSVFNPVLLGRERAAEIIINVFLPLAEAWSQATDGSAWGEKARELYRLYPRLEVNSIERHMLQQLDCSRGWIKTARCQQGLLHIYKTLCIQGKCRECELGV